jgi:hypothetical protein
MVMLGTGLEILNRVVNINYMCGSRDVAIYSVSYSVGSLINLITGALNSSFAPYQYQQILEQNGCIEGKIHRFLLVLRKAK